MLIALLFALHQLPYGSLRGPEAFAHYSRLLARAQFERSSHEEAAFLVSDAEGRIRAIDWIPGDPRMTSFHGRMPEHCIAVMHTHPNGNKEPSSGDRAEAQRIRFPILVITPAAVSVAWPDGTMSYLANHTGWNPRPQMARR
jgi:proteasome lid subunit RPN8/RPN11